MARASKIFSRIAQAGFICLFFGLISCSDTIYVHQNGTYYNDYEAVNHYRVQNANANKKVKSMTKSPNWNKYNAQNKSKRYNN